MSVPTEAEIRDAAAHLGLADENGNYPRGQRAKIAAAIQHVRAEQAEDADPMRGTTAEILARFSDDLSHAGSFTAETTTAVLTEAARHLLRTQGLQLNPSKETTPS